MSTTTPIGIFAAPLSIDGVGADTVLPPDAHLNGVTLRIPPWPAPSVIPGNGDLLEIWILEPGATVETLFYSNRFPVPVVFPASIPLLAQYLQLNGNIRLTYRVTAEDTGNPDISLPQSFIVRRAIPVNLKAPTFPSATLWGYLNCRSSPALWVAVIVRVPAHPGRFLANDVLELNWKGFSSLNGSGNAIPGTALSLRKTLTGQEAGSVQGFDFRLGSDKYEKHIKPMVINASALADYTHFRNGVALGRSTSGLVKIDRGVSGSPPCGPITQGVSSSTVVDHTNAGKTSIPGTCSQESRDFSLGHNVDDSTINSSMEYTNMNMQVKSGGIGVLAESPVVEGALPDGRLTYQQLEVDKFINVILTDIDEIVDGGKSVQVHLCEPGQTPIPFDPSTLLVEVPRPAGNWRFPHTIRISTDKFVDKFDPNGDYPEHHLFFVILTETGNNDDSAPTIVLVDRTAPYQRQPGTGNGTGTRPVLISQTGLPTVINDAWLADPANAGGINVTIPTGYTKFEALLDLVSFYVSTQTTFTGMQGDVNGVSIIDFPMPADGVINIPLAILRALRDGPYFYSYNLKDAPGNISNNSAITLLFSRVSAPAPVLGVPRIPVTGLDGRTPITLETSADPTKVVMEIDFPLNSLPGDRIVAEVFDSNGVPSPTIPEQQIPPDGAPGPRTLFFELDDLFWAAVYGNPNRQDEEQFTYRYRLIRPTISPDPVSQPEPFGILDRSYAGPEQPNLPDLLNPNITPVAVQGAGTPAPAPNTLGPAQAGLDAIMTWPLWMDADRLVTGREIVTFFYQGKQVGNPVGVRAGQLTVDTPLPWPTILAEGNGSGATAREAYIKIEYPGSANPMTQTPVTLVNVTAIVINLPPPQIIVSAFRTPTGTQIPERAVTSINCPSLDHPSVPNGPMPPYAERSLRIRILRDLNIPTGATVNLNFEGRVTNTVGGAAIPGTQITETGTMPATGVLDIFLRNYNAIRTIQLPSPGPGQRPATRFARIAYTVNGITSEVIVPVALLNSSLVYCEQNRP